MAREISWTKRGIRSLKRVVRYLEEEWDEKVTSDFLVQVFHTLDLLSRNPSLGTSEFPEKVCPDQNNQSKQKIKYTI